MESTFSQRSLTQGGIPFTLKDGTTGIIAPEARRTYDHIIQTRIGRFPLQGLTGLSLDTQPMVPVSQANISETFK